MFYQKIFYTRKKCVDDVMCDVINYLKEKRKTERWQNNMLTLSEVLCGHFKTTNTFSFSALLKIEKDGTNEPFRFLLYDSEDQITSLPCVFHPSCLGALSSVEVLNCGSIPIVVEIWCLVTQTNCKFIEIASFFMCSINKSIDAIENINYAEGVVVGKSVFLGDKTFCIHMSGSKGDFIILNNTQSYLLALYDLIYPEMHLSFNNLSKLHKNLFYASKTTHIHNITNSKWIIRDSDSFSGTITSLGFVLHLYSNLYVINICFHFQKKLLSFVFIYYIITMHYFIHILI